MHDANVKGFTLVELAVSLVVIGLLIGLGTALVGPLMSSIKVRESRDNLTAAIESVNSWATANNRLPDTTEFTSVARSQRDAWNQPFQYSYDAKLVSPATKDTICGKRSTVISLTDGGTTIANVAYVVLSPGEDATSSSSITAGAISTATTVTADTSNDLVRWVTLDELRTKVGCQGPQLRIVNNELPAGKIAAPYAATLAADGGFVAAGSNYRWCIETAQNLFQSSGGLTLNGLTGGAGTNPAGVSTTCTTAASITSQTAIIGGTPAATVNATAQLTVVVWDDNSNEARKKMVLTIHPQN